MEDPQMKRLLLTVAVTSLALNAVAAPGTGKGKEGNRPKTQEQRVEEAKKAGQAKSAGSSKETISTRDAVQNVINSNRLVSGTDATNTATRLSSAIEAGKLQRSDFDAMVEKSNSDQVAKKMVDYVVLAAKTNQLDGALAFINAEGVSYVNGKTQWSKEALEKLDTTLTVAGNELAQATGLKQVKMIDALTAGLKAAKFDENTIREILKKCFKIG